MRNTRRIASLSILAMAVLAAGCTRIESGEVGLRRNYNKTFETVELQPGSLNQTFIGDVFTFKVQDVGVDVNDLHPQAADNSLLKDFDATAIYSINPTSVSDIWVTKNRGFHTYSEEHHDWLLMNQYVKQVLNNAAFKVVRKYNSLELNDNRTAIETSIKQQMIETFKEEKLDHAIIVSQIQVRTMLPADEITQSANNLVRAQNDQKTKIVEVETAKREAERIAALNSNAKAIDYMNAQANMLVAQGIANGKVQTVVIPFDFKGMVSVK